MQEIRLDGRWKVGWALDLHTLKSVPRGDGGFDTEYTEIGKRLNLLKYHNDYDQIDVLAGFLCKFMQTRYVTPYLSAIIPVPPSQQRDVQPVYMIAERVGGVMNIPVDFNYLKKIKSTPPLKGMSEERERGEVLKGAFEVVDNRYAGKKVLVFDDLYRSGATLNEVCKVLYEVGNVGDVYVVTLTKTRSLR